MKDAGQVFIPGNPKPNKTYPQIPKQNKRFLEIEPELSSERTISLSVSSDKPYFRWFGWEELDHSEAAVNLERFNDGAQVLFNHKFDNYIGVIEKAWLDGGRLYNEIRFDTHELAEKIYQSIQSGIVRNVSIGYEINELKFVGQRDKQDVYRAVRWTPFESSIVTVPADASVGVGRSYYDLVSQEIETSSLGEKLKEKSTEVMSMPETPIINEKDLIQAERERVQGIHALAQKHGHSELAGRAIEEGLSIVDARSLYLDKVTLKEKQDPIAAGINPVGMSDKERKKYSTIKAVGYAAGLVKAEDVGLELEVSRAIQERNGKAPKKIYLDQSELVSYRAPYETGVPAAAGDLIETELLSDRFIEQLYNMSAFLSMGVTYLRDLTGNIEIPRESTYTNGYWVGEKATIPEDEGTFDKISLAPHKLAVLTKITFEMLEQSSIDIERLFRARLIRGLALELDRTIGFGSGIGSEPLGIASHPEVKSVVLGANGAPLDYAAVVAMQTELAAGNALTEGNSGYVFNARTRGKLMTTLDQSTGGGDWIYQSTGGNTGMVAGYQARCSNQIPNNLVKGTATDLTAAFFGDFSNVLLALWSGMDVMANPYSEFSEAIIQVRAMQLADINLTRGDFFAVASDIQNN